MISQASNPVMFDARGNAAQLNRVRRKVKGQAKNLFRGFKGANDQNLLDWVYQPIEINQILRHDLQRLRARSRDLARNDDTCRRYLALLRQNVLGHRGIVLQAKNKLGNGSPDTARNNNIETEWKGWGRKRRYRGQLIGPTACAQMSYRELEWLVLHTRAVDGECFVQILRGYPHNPHRYAVRLLDADLLDGAYSTKNKDTGNRIEMGIELDEFNRPVAYWFSNGVTATAKAARERIPADQILHVFRREFPGQLRGIPDCAGVMHKAKMLNGVNEAVVVGWRVAAAKMGFFVSKDDEDFADPADDPDDDTEKRTAPESSFDATPGSFDYVDDATDFKTFDVTYPDSTFREGHKVFMQQQANGYNVSTPTLSNDYSDVNYSSLRQALLEDRSGWRCYQAEFTDDFSQPLFDDWYEWSTDVTGSLAPALSPPVTVAIPRGYPWVDPLKEVRAQVEANANNLRTRQSIMADNDGGDFLETVDELQSESEALRERGLLLLAASEGAAEQETEEEDEDDA